FIEGIILAPKCARSRPSDGNCFIKQSRRVDVGAQLALGRKTLTRPADLRDAPNSHSRSGSAKSPVSLPDSRATDDDTAIEQTSGEQSEARVGSRFERRGRTRRIAGHFLRRPPSLLRRLDGRGECSWRSCRRRLCGHRCAEHPVPTANPTDVGRRPLGLQRRCSTVAGCWSLGMAG
ncbi:MAG: hypothetical protein QG597_1905, partial [Actinomycetota bacterium]|nr:hypothetical protein [Actinomycetota bacterium]